MQVIIDLHMTKEEYLKKAYSLDIIRPSICTNCGKAHKIYRHGWYFRYIADELDTFKIPIPRFYCTICKQTISILPNFCVPRFQYSASFIIMALKKMLSSTIKAIEDHLRSLYYFYKRRFINNLSLCEMYLRQIGITEAFPSDKKERAINIYHRLLSLPRAETLFQRFLTILGKHFMAI